MSYYFLVDIIFINLFIAIIVDGFNSISNMNKKLINYEIIHDFKIKWLKYDSEVNI